jgi:photosystem II stability/assembly factor-like uncharacterized protein
MRIVLALALAGVVAVAGTAALARGTGQAIPNGFEPVTAAAAGAHDLWVLGDYRCGSDTLCNVLFRSIDSGKHFTRLAGPLTSSADEQTLVFANARVGYAYAFRGALYVTRDGGETWNRALAQPTMALAVAGGNVYAVSGHCTALHGCRGFRLRRSSVSRPAWRTLELPISSRLPLGLAARASHVWVSGSAGSASRDRPRLARSPDDGQTFATERGPCFADLGGELVPAGHAVVWAVCGTGMQSITYRSTDGGRSFVSKHRYGQTNGALVAAAAPLVAVLDRGEGIKPPLLVRTTNGGSTWHGVQEPQRPEAVTSLQFATRRVGIAVVQLGGPQAELWRTTDGGATWHSVPIR